ncbi:MAG: hypothetical protein K8S25_15645 [Alphaproteobacteria bacterium]|nr:hypothetical protein [Alphaproteobacteria bacterium]
MQITLEWRYGESPERRAWRGMWDMRLLVRKWWFEIAIAGVVVLALGMGLSLSTNRQLAYAPCLAKVMTALRADPAAERWTKISSEPMAAQPADCAVAKEVARDANRVIGDLLISDPSLYDRLPQLLTQAGMECQSDALSIVCDCQARGPFAIANPCADCGTLIDLPLPLKRALFVAVNKRTGLRHGKTVPLGRYVVEVSYATAVFETERPPPQSVASPGSYALMDGMMEW